MAVQNLICPPASVPVMKGLKCKAVGITRVGGIVIKSGAKAAYKDNIIGLAGRIDAIDIFAPDQPNQGISVAGLPIRSLRYRVSERQEASLPQETRGSGS